ncbi:hypothetical protein [Staphylococcus felis]|uniref:hypothetical protein n=1 Tax=Staphylococcus felis TaxID=46127 RepID=UPI000E265948|nr:hypothetical protein [Staphylococcus felis]REI02476.1 hypothetical protein DOS64_01925 [Staphylococcus felis]
MKSNVRQPTQDNPSAVNLKTSSKQHMTIEVVEQVVRSQAEWNDEQNCFPNCVKLLGSVENSTFETPLIEL